MLAPLFTTSVATGTTTPAVSFAVSNAPGNSVLGNTGSTAAAPSYSSNPSVLTLTANSVNASTVTAAALIAMLRQLRRLIIFLADCWGLYPINRQLVRQLSEWKYFSRTVV